MSDAIRARRGRRSWHYDRLVRLRDATDMLRDSDVNALGPTHWADLGCGSGTFTLALASVLAAGSTIHAVDHDGAALRKLPQSHSAVRIIPHRQDFTEPPWPFAPVDGILMANSLHFVADQAAFVDACEAQMTPRRRFLVVEYDTIEANRWVPHPVSSDRLVELFERAGYRSIAILRRRASLYRRAPLYSAAIGP
jgi:trans-aconitate methyltransferase